MCCSLQSWMILSALVCAAPFDDDAGAVGPSEAIKSDRGGWLVTTTHHQFEVFFYKTGLRVFPTAASHAPIAVSKMIGTVSFALPKAKLPLVYAIKEAGLIHGREPVSLDLATDLSWVPVGQVKVEFLISELSDPEEDRVKFSVPFVLVAPRPAVTPSAPRYVYRSGYYGVGYYPAAVPVILNPLPAPAQFRPVQRAVPLEQPWSSPHWTDEYNEDMDHNM